MAISPFWPCTCFEFGSEMQFHVDQQDTECPPWKRLLEMIEEAAITGCEEFAPMRGMKEEDRRQIVTLPSAISKLKSVRVLVLYRTKLVRIPPEIGEMANLEEFYPYTSHSLHWFPYEITRCKKLKKSSVSTRALYGNYKHRTPFPKLPAERSLLDDIKKNTGIESIRTCSVCNRSFEEAKLYQVWISLKVAIDALPLLVNACSEDCIQGLPMPPYPYLPTPHRGGLDLKQTSQ